MKPGDKLIKTCSAVDRLTGPVGQVYTVDKVLPSGQFSLVEAPGWYFTSYAFESAS